MFDKGEAQRRVTLALAGYQPERTGLLDAVAAARVAVDAIAAWLDPEPAKATIEDLVVVCECGSDDFDYVEGSEHRRSLSKNVGGTLVFDGEFEWSDGDDDPGVVCKGCDRPVVMADGSAIATDWA